MKFDVIIGNPPYQLDTGGSGRQARPIYNLFVEQAKKMNPRHLIMIIPSRWFAGGMGLDGFRANMLKDKHFEKIVDYMDARDCFPSVDIAGGVCYFHWNRSHSDSCLIVSNFKNKSYEKLRDLNEFPTLIRLAPAAEILRKVACFQLASAANVVSATRPFGIPTGTRPAKKGELKLISSKGIGFIKADEVKSGHEMISKWKVMTSKTSHDHAGQPDKDGKRRVLSRIEVLEPKTVVTESYIILGTFEKEEEARNCLSFYRTKFSRFLISLLSFSQDITRERFAYVPAVPMTTKWTDERLYDYFNLTAEEIAFIDTLIRPMDPTDA